MADGIYNESRLSYFIPEVYFDQMLQNQFSNLVGAIVTADDRQYWPGEGKSVHIPGIGLMTAKTFDSDSTSQVVPQYGAQAEINYNIDTEKEISFVTTDKTDTFAKRSSMRKNIELQAYGLSAAVDTAFLAPYASFTYSVAAGTHTGSDFLTDILKAMYYLQNAKVPMQPGMVNLVVGPMGWYRLFGVTQIQSVETSQQQVIQTGVVRNILGFNVYMTQNIPTTESSGVTTEHCMLLHKEAISRVLVSQKYQEAPYYASNVWQTLHSGKVMYGANIKHAWMGCDIQVTVNI